MSIIIPWSGGMDSTCLLYESARDNPTEMVNAVTLINLSNSDGQSKMERKSREVLKKRINFKNISYHEIKIESKINNEGWQMPIWLATMLLSVRNNDIVKFAYLDSDGYDFFIGKENLVNAFNAFLKLRGIEAKIEFPYQNRTKGSIILTLKNIKLFKHCWYCGVPKNNKPCGKCMKCLDVKRWSQFPDTGVVT